MDDECPCLSNPSVQSRLTLCLHIAGWHREVKLRPLWLLAHSGERLLLIFWQHARRRRRRVFVCPSRGRAQNETLLRAEHAPLPLPCWLGWCWWGREGTHMLLFLSQGRQAGNPPPPHLLKSRHVNKKKHNFSQGGRSCHGNSVEWPSEAVDAILLGLDFVSHQQHSNSHVCSLEVWALLKWMIATTEEN